MSSDFIRWGGLAGIAAGMMYIVAGILNLLAPQSDVFVSLFDYLIEFVFAVAWQGTLGALASLHAAHREGYGQLGTAGSVTAFVGYLLLFVVSVANILAGREVLGIVVLLGLLGVLVGLILLGNYLSHTDLTALVRCSAHSRRTSDRDPQPDHKRWGDSPGNRLGAGRAHAPVERADAVPAAHARELG